MQRCVDRCDQTRETSCCRNSCNEDNPRGTVQSDNPTEKTKGKDLAGLSPLCSYPLLSFISRNLNDDTKIPSFLPFSTTTTTSSSTLAEESAMADHRQKDFHHPYTPYPIQLEFMNAVYSAIEDGCIGIFESPTGRS